MTSEEAISLAKTKWWESKTAAEVVMFQLWEPLLCMPFGVYHENMEAALGRPVWSHEFADAERLREEFLSLRDAPSMQEIVSQLGQMVGGSVTVVAVDRDTP